METQPMNAKDPRQLLEYLAVLDQGGVNEVLTINGVPVGIIQWDAIAATKAIAEAIDVGERSQAEVQAGPDGIGKPVAEEAGRRESISYAATVLGYGLGAELRMLAGSMQRRASRSPFVAQNYYTRCPGCGRRFVPDVDRKRPRDKTKGTPIGRRPDYCTQECQDENRPRSTQATRAPKTPAQKAAKAAAEQRRRDDRLAARLDAQDAATLYAIVGDPGRKKAHGAKLRSDPTLRRYNLFASFVFRKGKW